MIKGPLAGFIIADPTWENADVDSILEKLSIKYEPTAEPLLEDTENFMIEKE